MTERELIQQQQELGDSRFLVTRSGKFFSAYGCGAFALALRHRLPCHAPAA